MRTSEYKNLISNYYSKSVFQVQQYGLYIDKGKSKTYRKKITKKIISKNNYKENKQKEKPNL